MKQIHDLFGDVERFVATADLSPAAKVKLQNIMNNPNQKSQLMVELAITVDAREPFVKATYFLEGDGPLIFSCYEKILALMAVAYPGFAGEVLSQLRVKCKQKFKPGPQIGDHAHQLTRS